MLTLWSSHQSTLGLPVSPAALRTCVGFTWIGKSCSRFRKGRGADVCWNRDARHYAYRALGIVRAVIKSLSL